MTHLPGLGKAAIAWIAMVVCAVVLAASGDVARPAAFDAVVAVRSEGVAPTARAAEPMTAQEAAGAPPMAAAPAGSVDASPGSPASPSDASSVEAAATSSPFVSPSPFVVPADPEVAGAADLARALPLVLGSTAVPLLSPVEVSPWAVAVSHGSSWMPDAWVDRVAQAGVSEVRGFADDATVVAAQTDAGLGLTGFLQWGTPGDALAFPVDDLDGWRAYVTRMVSTYPEVEHWEVWNEPPNFTTDTDPAHYAQIVVAAYDAVKAIEPSIQVGLASKSTDIRWMSEAISAGAAGHFDYVTLHPYERIGMLVNGNEASYLGIVPTVRAMLADVAPDQVDVPVRFTEAGIPVAVAGRTFGVTTVSPTVQAETLVKVYAMGIAQGVESIAWFDPYDGDYVDDSASEPPFGLIERGGAARPALTTLSSMIDALGSHPSYAGMVTPDDGTFAFAFADGADTVVVAWSSNATSLPVDTAVQVTDPTTGTTTGARDVVLGTAPVLVRIPETAAARWVESTQSGVRERSGEAGSLGHEDPSAARLSAEDGMLGVALAASRPTQVVDGRLAYVMSGSSSVKLVVDPAFSAWDRTPVTVTAVVHQIAGSPGFNLKYDADSGTPTLDWAGQRSTGSWRSVPGGRWVTVTWTLDDASFVGKYGFGLRLDSDSAVHSDYALASLTIARG